MTNNEQKFEEYLSEILLNSDKLYYNYLGILKKDYPKWSGWKIISEYKTNGTQIKEIRDDILDMHVRNFHYTIYISKKYN